MRYEFETRGGEKVAVDLEINEEAVARYMADRVHNRRQGATKATALDGAIIATRVA